MALGSDEEALLRMFPEDRRKSPKDFPSRTPDKEAILLDRLENPTSPIKPGEFVRITQQVFFNDEGQAVTSTFRYTLEPGEAPFVLSIMGCCGEDNEQQHTVASGMDWMSQQGQAIFGDAFPGLVGLHIAGDFFYEGKKMADPLATEEACRWTIKTYGPEVYDKTVTGKEGERHLLSATPVHVDLGNHELGYFSGGNVSSRKNKKSRPGGYSVAELSGHDFGARDQSLAALAAKRTCQYMSEDSSVLTDPRYFSVKKFHQPTRYYNVVYQYRDQANPFLVIFHLDSNSFCVDEEQKKWFKEEVQHLKSLDAHIHINVVCHHSLISPGKRAMKADERITYDLRPETDDPEKPCVDVPATMYDLMLQTMLQLEIPLGDILFFAAHDHFGAVIDNEHRDKSQHVVQFIAGIAGATTNNRAFKTFAPGLKSAFSTFGTYYFVIDPRALDVAHILQVQHTSDLLREKPYEILGEFQYQLSEAGYRALSTNPLAVQDVCVDKCHANELLHSLHLMMITGNWGFLPWILAGYFKLDKPEGKKAIRTLTTTSFERDQRVSESVMSFISEKSKTVLSNHFEIIADLRVFLSECVMLNFFSRGQKKTSLYNQLNILIFFMDACLKIFQTIDELQRNEIGRDEYARRIALFDYQLSRETKPHAEAESISDSKRVAKKRRLKIEAVREAVRCGVKKYLTHYHLSEEQKMAGVKLFCMVHDSGVISAEHLMGTLFHSAHQYLKDCVFEAMSRISLRNPCGDELYTIPMDREAMMTCYADRGLTDRTTFIEHLKAHKTFLVWQLGFYPGEESLGFSYESIHRCEKFPILQDRLREALSDLLGMDHEALKEKYDPDDLSDGLEAKVR